MTIYGALTVPVEPWRCAAGAQPYSAAAMRNTLSLHFSSCLGPIRGEFDFFNDMENSAGCNPHT